MRVHVRLYGGLRSHSSSTPLKIEITDGATVADLITSLGLRQGEVWLATLGDSLLEMSHPLAPDDELSLIPPVGGGT